MVKTPDWVSLCRDTLKTIGIAQLGVNKYTRKIPPQELDDLIVRQAERVANRSGRIDIGAFSLLSYGIFGYEPGNEKKIISHFEALQRKGALKIKPDDHYKYLIINVYPDANENKPFILAQEDYEVSGTPMNIILDELKLIHEKTVRNRGLRQLVLNPQDYVERQIVPDHLYEPPYEVVFREHFRQK